LALQEGFGLVSIDTWLVVIPQIIARIHTNNPQVRGCWKHPDVMCFSSMTQDTQVSHPCTQIILLLQAQTGLRDF
jgi:hypothetical protein